MVCPVALEINVSAEGHAVAAFPTAHQDEGPPPSLAAGRGQGARDTPHSTQLGPRSNQWRFRWASRELTSVPQGRSRPVVRCRVATATALLGQRTCCMPVRGCHTEPAWGAWLCWHPQGGPWWRLPNGRPRCGRVLPHSCIFSLDWSEQVWTDTAGSSWQRPLPGSPRCPWAPQPLTPRRPGSLPQCPGTTPRHLCGSRSRRKWSSRLSQRAGCHTGPESFWALK